MNFRMDKTLRFWVDCSYEDKRYENANRTRAELMAEILREYERAGNAMRFLNAKWSRVLRYAAEYKSSSEPLAAFVQRKGGIKRQGRRYG